MFFKRFCFILFFSSTFFIDAVFSSCPYVTLPNGRVRYVNRGKRIKFSCFKPYTLIGNTKIECENGEWKGAIPVCASKNCDILPKLLHGRITYYNERAVAKMQCNPDFTLIGSPQMHCIANLGWNDTVTPQCRANSIRQFGICHFEPNDTKQCEWVSRSGIFNWTIMSSRPEDNPHMPVDSFPSHDHTLSGLNSSGHFLYLEALFARTKLFVSLMDTKNATAKYISPLFPPFDEDEPHCLIFYLYANGSHAGIVEVLINEDSIWRSNGSIGTEWKKINIPLRNRSTQFRITIEGKGELGHYTRTAIDDLRIAVGEECQESHRIEVSAGVDVEKSNTQSLPESEEYNEETEKPHEEQPSSSQKSTFENIIMMNNESIPEENNSIIKVEDSNSNTEITVFQNNVTFHSPVENKNEDDDASLVDQEIHVNSTHDHESDNNLQINIPAINSSSNESSIKQTMLNENQEFNKDMTILEHQFSNETEKLHTLSNISVTSTTHLTPISNNTVVESNDAENKYDHQEENSRDEIEENRDYPRHVEKNKNVLQKKFDYVVHSENGNSNGSEIFWVVMFTISGVMLLFFVLIYIRYRKRRKDDGSLHFLEKDDGCSDSSRTKDDVLMLKYVPNNS